MKLKDKIKSYSFWVSLTSAIILILKILGNRFNFIVDETMVSDLFTALCSILVLLGIIVPPSQQVLTTQKLNSNSITNHTDEVIQDKPNIIEIKAQEEVVEEMLNEEQKISTITSETEPETIQAQDVIAVEEQTKSTEKELDDISNEIVEENNQTTPDTSNIKDAFNIIREKFSNNIEEYIFELQEELRKTREGM
ncbi:MAG: hypothetical protein IKJ33_02010 [Clostridia bacterium]|nr:hypothetical protein [Clostridia bacterium]